MKMSERQLSAHQNACQNSSVKDRGDGIKCPLLKELTVERWPPPVCLFLQRQASSVSSPHLTQCPPDAIERQQR